MNLAHIKEVINKNRFESVIGAASLLVIITVFFMQPIAQDPAYHNFADTNSYYGIANALNVLSNLPFLIVGIFGLYCFRSARGINASVQLRYMFAWFFAGVSLTAFGSAYYHLEPNNTTLVWDRLPMTIAFMAFFCIVVANYMSARVASVALIPLLVFGVASVVYWHYIDDLRLYALVQFLPILLMCLILIFRSSSTLPKKYVFWTIAFYALSKLAELLDQQIYDVLYVISGHSLKHMLAAMAPFVVALFLYKQADR